VERQHTTDKSAAIKFASQARSPLLMLQGMDDDGVMREQGESLYDVMHSAGKQVDYVAYVGDGHGLGIRGRCVISTIP